MRNKTTQDKCKCGDCPNFHEDIITEGLGWCGRIGEWVFGSEECKYEEVRKARLRLLALRIISAFLLLLEVVLLIVAIAGKMPLPTIILVAGNTIFVAIMNVYNWLLRR